MKTEQALQMICNIGTITRTDIHTGPTFNFRLKIFCFENESGAPCDHSRKHNFIRWRPLVIILGNILSIRWRPLVPIFKFSAQCASLYSLAFLEY